MHGVRNEAYHRIPYRTKLSLYKPLLHFHFYSGLRKTVVHTDISNKIGAVVVCVSVVRVSMLSKRSGLLQINNFGLLII